MIYEAFPEYFHDNQFNIPDKFDSVYNIIGKGNGIPDIIDEAVWGTLIWEYLQNDDGSIQWGTETKGYPSPFDAPLDKDTKKYGTVIIDDKAAAVGAGLFMHLARIIKPYDSTYSSKLAARGVKSYEYVKAKMADPEKFYYFTQKYLFDGDTSAHEQMKSLKAAVEIYRTVYDCPGYSLNNTRFDNPAYFMSYILQKERPTDSGLVASCMNALKSTANGYLQQLTKYQYPVGNNPVGSIWGHNVMQPIFACAPLLYWRMTKEQSYFDGACALMNYILGVNPLGISYVTGLGIHQVHFPHDRESAYSRGKGWGSKPGIVVFGPGVLQGASLTTFPEIGTLPVERQFGDDMSSISTAEFTIFQTMSHNSLYTILSGGGSWNETNDPFASQQKIGVRKPFVKKVEAVPAFLQIKSGFLTCKAATPAGGTLHCRLYALNGKEIARFDFGKSQSGTHTYATALGDIHRGTSLNGVVVARLSLDNKIIGCSALNFLTE
jgi:endoglucanase